MTKSSYVFLGMAIHAFAAATLQALNLITVTPGAQGITGVLALIIVAITAIAGKR